MRTVTWEKARRRLCKTVVNPCASRRWTARLPEDEACFAGCHAAACIYPEAEQAFATRRQPFWAQDSFRRLTCRTITACMQHVQITDAQPDGTQLSMQMQTHKLYSEVLREVDEALCDIEARCHLRDHVIMLL